jgi:hypothetical protein
MLPQASTPLFAAKVSELLARLRGLDWAGKMPLLTLLRDWLLGRCIMTLPASGDAITVVPGVAIGGGVGESERKRG